MCSPRIQVLSFNVHRKEAPTHLLRLFVGHAVHDNVAGWRAVLRAYARYACPDAPVKKAGQLPGFF